MDLPQAEPEKVRTEIEEIIGLDATDAVCASAKTGLGVEQILEDIIVKVPPPQGDLNGELKALIIDSWFDNYLGVVSLVRVFAGNLKKGDKIKAKSIGKGHVVDSVGVFTPKRSEMEELSAGEVGFVVAGIKDIHKCTSVRHSIKAQDIGCDAVSVDGFECGGHPGEDDIPNFILLPRAADELSIPFVASGGMADARSLVAAMALGAEGMNMGTRFIATKDAPVHDNVKQAILNASELDTRLVMRPLRNTERVLNNKGVEKILEKEEKLGAHLKFEDIIKEVSGVYPKVMLEGDMDAGAWSCGMVAGLIHDIPTVKELVDRIMEEAEDLIKQRLEGLLSA